MEKVKKILGERANGLFLLLFAGLIVTGLSYDFSYAGFEKGQNQPEEEQVLSEEQVRGEEDDSLENNVQEAEENSDVPEEPAAEAKEASAEKADDKSVPDPGETRCEDLKRLLKKYCGENYNVKKCRDYLIETKDLSKKYDQCKSLYKKYHFVPKKEEKKDNSDSDTNSGEIKEEATLVINYGDGKADDKYSVVIGSGMTVMDMMRKAKEKGLSYDESADWPGYIQEINGVKEDRLKSLYWMFYSNGAMSEKGASILEVKAGDKIEWVYTKF